MPDVYTDALDWRRQQVEEYSQYVAGSEVRNATGVVVYGHGYPVPAGNVEADGSIVLLRHACPGIDPFTQQQCEIPHNAVLEKTEPGVATKVNTKKSSASKEGAK